MEVRTHIHYETIALTNEAHLVDEMSWLLKLMARLADFPRTENSSQTESELETTGNSTMLVNHGS
jgi:hypothetical protein